MDPVDRLTSDLSQLAITDAATGVAHKPFQQKYALISAADVPFVFSHLITSWLDFDSCCSYAMTSKAAWERRVAIVGSSYHLLSTARVKNIVKRMLKERPRSQTLSYFDDVLTHSLSVSKTLNVAHLSHIYRFTQPALNLSLGDRLLLQVHGNSLSTLAVEGSSKSVAKLLVPLGAIGSQIRDLRITICNYRHDPDIFIAKIVSLFPQLAALQYSTSRLIGEDGYAALLHLHNLRKLSIGSGWCVCPSLTVLAKRLDSLWFVSGPSHVSRRDMAALGGLSSLRAASLGMYENTGLKALEELEGHERLNRLNIYNIASVSLETLSSLRTLPHLQSLAISASEWRYKALMALNTLSLSYLEIGSCVNASHAAWNLFSKSPCMQTLQSLIMYRPRNQSSFHILEMASAPLIETLTVYNSDFVPHWQNPMCTGNSLRSLTFIQCYDLNDAFLSRFAACPKLVELNVVESGEISGSFLLTEEGFPSLRDLYISLSGNTPRAALEQLAALPIEVLDLRGSRNLTVSMVARLFRTKTIRKLYLPQGAWWQLGPLFKKHSTINAVYAGDIQHESWTHGTIGGYKRDRSQKCFRVFYK